MSTPVIAPIYMVETAEVESASKMFTSGLPSCRNRSRPLKVVQLISVQEH